MNVQIPSRFTLDELLSHLREQEGMEGFFTAAEWADHFGISVRAMRPILSDAKAAGKLRVSQARRETLDGRNALTPVYSFDLENDDAGA
jgi:hypothetical protein